MAKFTILQQNVNSLGSNGAELKTLLQNKHIQPEVIILQETRLSKKKNFNIPGYNIIRKDPLSGKKGQPKGGLMTYVKHGIDYQTLDIDIEGIEIMGIKTYIDENKPTNILNVYLPNTTTITIDILNKLRPYLTPSAYLGGDFNAHNSLWGSDAKTNPRGLLIEKWLEENNLIALNNGEPTYHRITSNIYTSIDLGIVTPDLINDTTFYVHDDSWGSDHFPIFTSLKSSHQNTDDH